MAFPGTYNFSYYRGDTSQFVVRPKTANGSAFDLTGYSASFVIGDQRGSGATQYSGTAIVDETENIVTCTITPAVGRNLERGNYVYDVQIDNGVQIYTLLTGGLASVDDIAGAV